MADCTDRNFDRVPVLSAHIRGRVVEIDVSGNRLEVVDLEMVARLYPDLELLMVERQVTRRGCVNSRRRIDDLNLRFDVTGLCPQRQVIIV